MDAPRRPFRRLAAALTALAALAGCSAGDAGGGASAAAPPGASTTPPPSLTPATTWYVSLGDSLAAGYQPGTGDDPATGYAGRLADRLREREPGLRLQAFGCSGETARSLRAGGVCLYARGSQLAQAESFLSAHRGRVRLVTIDIGANDVLRCTGGGPADRRACVDDVLPPLRSDVAGALRRLRAAAPGVQVVGMTYYDPLLATWLLGPQLRPFARQSARLMARTNAVLARVYRAAGAQVADVAATFGTGRTGLVDSPRGRVPRDVATVCRLTWMCSRTDIHANDAGYRHIAATFAAVVHDRATSRATG